MPVATAILEPMKQLARRFQELVLPAGSSQSVPVQIDPSRCTGCGDCIEVCGSRILGLDGDKATPAHGPFCIRCTKCASVCPEDAIWIEGYRPDEFEDLKDPGINSEALLVIHTAEKRPLCELDAAIAGTYLNLAAETRNIGVQWLGYHVVLSRYFKRLRRLSRIPAGHRVLVSMILGYKAKHFTRVRPKQEPKVAVYA